MLLLAQSGASKLAAAQRDAKAADQRKANGAGSIDPPYGCGGDLRQALSGGCAVSSPRGRAKGATMPRLVAGRMGSAPARRSKPSHSYTKPAWAIARAGFCQNTLVCPRFTGASLFCRARGKTAHPSSNTRYIRYPDSQLRNGNPTAHGAVCLVLLGSPPDTIHRSPIAQDQIFNTAYPGQTTQRAPSVGISSPL